jgi:hypothetical protein
MKPFILIAASILALSTAPLSSAAQGLVAHVWGTFATLHGQYGENVSGLYLKESWPEFFSRYIRFFPGGENRYGQSSPALQGASVIMESPVICLYSKKRRDFVVNAGFGSGMTLPEYQAPDGVNDDIFRPFPGWIQWDTRVTPPGTEGALSLPQELQTTTSRSLRGSDTDRADAAYSESEKFLFYRGVGNFTVPLGASFNNFGELVVTNRCAEAIPYVFVYNSKDGESGEIWWTGRLGACEVRNITAPTTERDPSLLTGKLTEFEDEIVAAGLFRKEAEALLATWYKSYFGTPGLRLLWIVPKGFTNTILPVSFTPAPDGLQRVLIGRSEIPTWYSRK